MHVIIIACLAIYESYRNLRGFTIPCGGNYHNNNENFLELLLKHAGGDEKLAIHFHWPYGNVQTSQPSTSIGRKIFLSPTTPKKDPI